MKNCVNKNGKRLISGYVSDSNNNPVYDSVVILYVNYINKRNIEITEKLAYTTTNLFGEFSFIINLSDYPESTFIIEANNPFKEIY
ncbi:hypothetical protein M4I33_03935 [Clostridium sp. LY3-2]|uniref:hypothetical protein n=1 Tax=Clostridium sp. LY3-2 TaxID=2942482 RepID=UPI0021534DC9|nr:hypothetical protein [Clostridium sp. LY3-2]MCR6514027.1 hypothetical protein [Clostridium sp. LY3-2]